MPAQLQIVQPKPLSKRETQRYAELEGIIKANFKGFVQVCMALREIRDTELYRREYISFEEYCRDKWEMSRPRAYQLIGAADVLDDLSTVVDINDDELVIKERHLRPLIKLAPKQRAQAWQKATKRSEEHTSELQSH